MSFLQPPRHELVALKALGAMWRGPDVTDCRHLASLIENDKDTSPGVCRALAVAGNELTAAKMPEDDVAMFLFHRLFFAISWFRDACPVFDLDDGLATDLSDTDPPLSDWVRMPFRAIVIRHAEHTVLASCDDLALLAAQYFTVGAYHAPADLWKWRASSRDKPIDSPEVALVLNLCAYVTQHRPVLATPRKGWQAAKKGYTRTRIAHRTLTAAHSSGGPVAGPDAGVLRARHRVRGHWRNQAHGPGYSRHTLRWIMPQWRGGGQVADDVRYSLSADFAERVP